MSVGLQVQDFADFIEATGPSYEKGRDFINDAVLNTYFFGRLINGVSEKYLLRGGSDIRKPIVFEDNGSFREYLPTETRNWVNPQRLQKSTINWRFSEAHMTWEDQEILLNDVIMYGRDDAVFQQYVDLRDEKETLMYTAKWNGLEGQLWAQPNASLQEGTGTDAKAPIPIPAYVNEWDDGLVADGPGSWAGSTIAGIDPTAATTKEKWKPNRVAYDSDAVTGAAADGNILGALDECRLGVKFDRPQTHQQYFENPQLNKQMILTSKRGWVVVASMMRQSQDHFVYGSQDSAYPNPMHHGVPIEYVSSLDTLAAYDSSSAGTLTTEALAAGTQFKGPRFYMLNGNFMHPVMHVARYFFKDKPSRHHNAPETWVQRCVTWWNLHCTSRQRQGIVYPGANFYYA